MRLEPGIKIFAMNRCLLWQLLAMCAAVMVGCSNDHTTDYSQLKLVNAYGQVTLDGKPLANAVITFDAEDGQFSYGMTDSGGDFTLQIDSEQSGVTPGTKTVRISTARKIFGLNTEDGGGEGSGGEGPDGKPLSKTTEQVPAKYNMKSELTVEVSSAKREHNFDLKSN
jgi:hypothetical protein